MRYIIHIGPDTIGIRSTSKGKIKLMLKRAKRCLAKRGAFTKNDWYSFRGVSYIKHEIDAAIILTYNEYFKAIEVIR